MRLFWTLLTISLFATNSYAQNSSLLERKEAEFSVDLNSVLNEETAATGDLNALMRYVFQAFSTDHLRSRYFERTNPIEIEVPLYDGLVNWDYIRKVKALYKAAIPVFQAQFKQMSVPEQQAYLDFVQTGIDYSSNFDLEKEQADLAAAHEEGWGFHEKKGSLKAFIYRRIANEEMSQKDCIYWLKKLYKDLAAKKNKKASPEDRYYLIPIYGAEQHFAIGKVLSDSLFTLFEKKGSDWQPIKIDNKIPFAQHNNYYHNLSYAAGGVWVLFPTTDVQSNLYLLRPEQAILDLGKVDNPNTLELWKAIPLEGDALQLPNGNVYAMNKVGQPELKNFPENSFNVPISLFKFQSGEQKLLYHQNVFKAGDIKNATGLYYGKKRYECWVVADNKALYYFWDRNDPKVIDLPEAVDSLQILDQAQAIIHYKGRKLELISFAKKDKPSRMQLAQKLTYKAIQAAWKTKAGRVLYKITLKNDLVGLIDDSGQLILEPIYRSISSFNAYNSNKEYIWLTMPDNKNGIASIDGKILLQPIFNSLLPFDLNRKDDKNYFLFGMNAEGLVGLMDDNGKILLPPNYRNITKIQSPKQDHSYLLVQTAQGKKGLLSIDGQQLIAPQYSYLSVLLWEDKEAKPLFLFSETVDNTNIRSLKKQKTRANFGLINDQGKIVQKPTYFAISDLVTDIELGNISLFFVGKDMGQGKIKYAIYSKTFVPLSDFLFTSTPFEEMRYNFNPETFEEEVERVSDERCYLQSSYSQDQMILLQDGKQTVYDFNGKQLVPPTWDSIAFSIIPEHFVVMRAGKFGIVETLGKTIIAAEFDHIYNIGKFEQPKANYVYFAGKRAEDNSMRYALYSFEGKALSKHLFTIGKQMTYYFDPETFEEIETEIETFPGNDADFGLGTLLLQQNDKQVLANPEGEILIPAADIIAYISSHNKVAYYMVKDGGLAALFDHQGKQLCPFIYSKITSGLNGFEAIGADSELKVQLGFDGKEKK